MSDENGKNQNVVISTSDRTGKPIEVRVRNGETQYKCEYCGKWLTNEDAVDAAHGSYCQKLREMGLDDAALTKMRIDRTVAEVPVVDGGKFNGKPWIKTSILHRLLVKEGIPVARMVSAMGGDRGIESAARDEFAFVYCGRARWVHPWAASSEGLNYLREYRKTGTTEAALQDKPVGDVKKGTRKRKKVSAKAKVEKTAEALVTE